MSAILYILLPCYNAEKTIERAINSIEGQLSEKIKLLIINDGSTDNTKKLIDKYLTNKHINYIEHNNVGLSKTLRIGINYLKERVHYTCYVARLDSDDEFTNTGAIEILNIINNTNHKYECYFAPLLKDCYKVKERKVKDGYLTYEDFIKKNTDLFFDSVSSILSLDIFCNKKYWFNVLDRAGDWIPSLRIQKEFGLYLTNTYFYIVHQVPNSLSRRLITKEYAKIALETNLLLLNEFCIPYIHIKRKYNQIGNTYYIVARYYAVLRNYKQALYNLKQGLKYNPTNFLYIGLVLICLLPNGYKIVNFFVKIILFKNLHNKQIQNNKQAIQVNMKANS